MVNVRGKRSANEDVIFYHQKSGKGGVRGLSLVYCIPVFHSRATEAIARTPTSSLLTDSGSLPHGGSDKYDETHVKGQIRDQSFVSAVIFKCAITPIVIGTAQPRSMV